VGTGYVGFLNKHDRTFLNINGKLVIEGTVVIGKGCRLDICKGAVCTLRQCSITGQTNLIIAHSLEIGEGSVISWGCELSDEDWHDIKYEGKREKDLAIVVGRHVWIGSYVKILKGVHVGDNSVIASSAVVTRSFTEKNVLIAGNPAEIIKSAVEWS
jgi:acetyltransferase-like isoleucine patch superfamily enzyme